MRLSVLVGIVLSGMTTLSFALNPKPTSCPSVVAIKAAPLIIQKDFITSDGRTFYYAIQEDQEYGTQWKPLWHFEIYDIEATTPAEARQKANQAMHTLAFKDGPYSIGNLGWTCDYMLSSGYTAYAYSNTGTSSHRASLHF